MQEGMDTTIQQLSEAQTVGRLHSEPKLHIVLNALSHQNQGLVDETTNAQIDTLILDNRKKLNQIIGIFSFIKILRPLSHLIL